MKQEFKRIFDGIAGKRLLIILVAGILSFGGSWLVAYYRGVPVPHIHDEFSYLLAGDTFAHDRLTNPTHPMWRHFETFHELMQPTYMSKYPPGQGLFLALGQIIYGQPIYGVWLSAACMCMAICWMLYGWISPRWALVGGMVGVLQFGIFTYWSQSYWGGAVGALGGALVFGALPRIFRYQRMRDALWLGVGIAVLVNSRPFEGILLGIPLGIMVLPWKIKWESVKTCKFIKKIGLPFGLILLLTIITTGTYNKALTGNALIFPHVLYDKTYSTVPYFAFEPLRKTTQYNNRIYEAYEKKKYLHKRSWGGFVEQLKNDMEKIFKFFLGFPLAVPAVVIVLVKFLCKQWIWPLIITIGIIAGTCAAVSYPANVHYYAPFTCLVILLITYGLRYLVALLPRFRIGMIMVVSLMIFQLSLNIRVPQGFSPAQVFSLGRIIQSSEIRPTFIFTRQVLKDFLLSKKGKHLVVIKYLPKHDVLREWVFNDADIDHSPIVWARDMGTAKNAELLEYFKDRQVWYVEVFWDMKLNA